MTEAPLRAFVMMRSDDGNWAVTVCRDLGAVLRTWEARKEPDRDVAVLHVGFDRQPSHTFDDTAGAYPGHMLLTAAAKHVLPSSFVASAAPIGRANDTEVFIGLRGWGYSREDPTVRVDRSEPARANSATPEPQGWVASFLSENPSAAEALSAHGIHDDASYLEGESNLERSVRGLSGLFRAHHLVGATCDDPCELARAAPPWLAERDLTTLNLSVRANNAFRVSEIETVRDLTAWSPEALLKQRNFGRKSLRYLLQALNAALVEGLPRFSAADSVRETGQLLTEVRKSLLSFTGREHDVLVRRLGFEMPPQTLQQVADDHEVTRERIRQIEARATQKWIREFSWDDILEQKITRLLIGRSFPLPVAGVEAVDSWFDGVSSHLEFFKNFVQAVCKDGIHFIEIDGLCYISLMDQDFWEQTASEAVALLSSGAGREWREEDARSLVHGLLPDTAREFGPLLWDRASRLCHFSVEPDGSRVLTSYGRGAEQLVEAILAESETPLHYTEIAERAGRRQGKSLDLRRAQSAAANIGFLFAPGTFGLARHVPLSDEQMSCIRTVAEDIVCSETSGRQWHSSEVFSELLERLDGDFDGLDKYVLNIALAKSRRLKSLGKMTWAEAKQDTDDRTRIDIHQAVIAIVKAAGCPLSTGEIKKRLTAVRGVSEFFQIFPVAPLVRVRPGIWGINDRDVPLSSEEQAGLVEELIQILEEQQRGIHASELSEALLLKDCPPDAFLSLAAQDGRLKIAQGRYVYLAKWGSPRRETLGQAVMAVLEKAGKPLTFDEVVSLVARRVGRKYDRPAISGALQALEAEFDGMTKEWSVRTPPTGDGDDNTDVADSDSFHLRQVTP